jgi:hypothetical protein
MQHDLESKLNKCKGQVYTLEAELFPAKLAEEDLKGEGVRMAKANERLKEEQATANEVLRRAAIQRK